MPNLVSRDEGVSSSSFSSKITINIDWSLLYPKYLKNSTPAERKIVNELLDNGAVPQQIKALALVLDIANPPQPAFEIDEPFIYQMDDATLEKLSALQHRIWSDWMRYLFEKCTRGPDGTMIIPEWGVERWSRQMTTTFEDLPEEDKDSDRKVVKKYNLPWGDE